MFSVTTINADDLDDFRKLSAEEKVEKILEEYRYNEYWVRRLRFSQYASILTEDRRKTIPVLFRYLESLDMVPVTESDKAYFIIDSILWRTFYIENELFNRKELKKLATIYEQKMHKYLERYKVIDLNIVLTETQIEIILNNKNDITNPNIGKIIYEKYTRLGYKDLQLVYEPLR